jgi:hypothetical protein
MIAKYHIKVGKWALVLALLALVCGVALASWTDDDDEWLLLHKKHSGDVPSKALKGSDGGYIKTSTGGYIITQ